MRLFGRLARYRIRKFWQKIIVLVANNCPQIDSLVWGAALFYLSLDSKGRTKFYEMINEFERGVKID